MDDFYRKVADTLEIDELKASDTLEGFPEWDSLGVLSVIAMVGAEYNVNLTSRDLRSVETAGALHALVSQKLGKMDA